MGPAGRIGKWQRAFGLSLLTVTALMRSLPVAAAANGGESADYLVGVGSYDITGPAADVNMMGYANPSQNAAGIHFRLRSRAFIVGELPPEGSGGALGGGGENRVVFVNIDACMADQGVTLEVLKRLKARYGGLYTEKNVIISGIHTHSGPGGYLQYVLYIVTSLGFVRQSFDALADGIERSIVAAHESLQPGRIFVNEGELLDGNLSRSPSSYLENPAEERARYAHDTDKTMTLLRLTAVGGGGGGGPLDLGAFSWYPVHGVSMSRTNELVSGDNKGAAARFMEDWAAAGGPAAAAAGGGAERGSSEGSGARRLAPEMSLTVEEMRQLAAQHPASGGQPTAPLVSRAHRVRRHMRSPAAAVGAAAAAAPAPPPFVAAFAQSNEGDVTPNVLGAYCLDTGLPCDFKTSTCNGKTQLCIGRGPSYPDGDQFNDTQIIGERQFHKARELFLAATEPLRGPIDFRHAYVPMDKLEVELPAGAPGGGPEPTTVHTCPAAAGFSFAGGTTDGPGAFDFTQGDSQGNLFWKVVGGFIRTPSRKQKACQAPKPILLDTGELNTPYPWAPSIVPISIHRIGQLVILAVPAEFTTMSGRRLREAVAAVLRDTAPEQFGNGTRLVIAGLSNAYSQYVATYEEYQAQRYEGASTLYGPHTLSAYLQEFRKLAVALARGASSPAGAPPESLISRQIGFLPPVIADSTPLGVAFGDVKEDVPPGASFAAGGGVATAVFYTGCLRNDLHTEGTFVAVEQLVAPGKWASRYDDDDWSLRFGWSRPFQLSTQSYASVRWEVPADAEPGVYRFRHFGAYKKLLSSTIYHFTGTSSSFVVS